jgi:hypothetical protein
VLTLAFIVIHTMYEVSDKRILNNPEPLSQDGIQASYPYDGLRLLARLIARDLLAKRSTDMEKNVAKADDTKK